MLRNIRIVPATDADDSLFDNIDFVSFVSSPGGAHPGTYGKPPIIAPGTDEFVAASQREGEVTVLFVNPANILAMQVTKTP